MYSPAISISKIFRSFFHPILWGIVLGICLVCGCDKKTGDSEKKTPPEKTAVLPLERVLSSGHLYMITFNNANCYYQYRDRYMGFEYEMAEAFADYLGVKLHVRVADSLADMHRMLAEEPGAFIATGQHLQEEDRERFLFSIPYMTVRYSLIVRRDNKDIQTLADLQGKKLYVSSRRSGSHLPEKLREQGIVLKIFREDESDDYSEKQQDGEELIRLVADGKIEAAAAESHTAFLHRRHYPRAVLKEEFGKEFPLAWALHPRAEKLLDRMNAFLTTFQKSGRFFKLYERYYGEIPLPDFDQTEHFLETLSEHLPLYYSLIRKAADKNGFDWRLITAQIYQESHFNPKARSPAGAMGLMQIIRPTGKSLKVTQLTDPAQNIRAGVLYLKNLYDFFDNAEGEDRLKIALSAYNVGQGHIRDARNIARAQGLDPELWTSLAHTLPLLQHEEYHRDALYGYCRGSEPVAYVRNIMSYYEILKRRYPPDEMAKKQGISDSVPDSSAAPAPD